MRILLIEDAEDVADAIQRRLSRLGHAVDCQVDGLEAARVLAYQPYDLVILDIGLPGQNGLRVLQQLRETGDKTPVLMLTARAHIEDRVTALDFGADDYLAKPFDFRELEARCRALLRRRQDLASGVTRIGTLLFDRNAMRVMLDGAPLELPKREFRLLEIFIGSPGRVLGKHDIARQLFSFDDEVSDNAVELYVGRLRRKIGSEALNIRTVRGLGYIAEPRHDAITD